MGFRLGMSVSDGSPLRHVGLQSGKLVSNQASRSPIRHVGLRWVSDGSPMRDVGISEPFRMMSIKLVGLDFLKP